MRRFAAVVASLALVAGGLAAFGPAGPAGASGTVGTPIFGTRTTTTPIAGTSSFYDRGPARCPSGSVVTGIVALQNNIYAWLTGVQLVCSAVDVSGGTAQLGTPTSGPGIIGDQSSYSSIPSSCPSGSVVTGFQNGRTGTLVDAVQLSCAALDPSGSLGTPSQGDFVGGPGGNVHGPSPCPAGAVATGAIGVVSDDLDSISFECQALTYQQPIPTNGSWPTARTLSTTASIDDTLASSGQQLWYKVPVAPGSRVQVDLSGLPADYDLAVFKDIGQAFNTLTSPADLTKLSAEFAGDAYNPSAVSSSAFAPFVFTPSSYTPFVFTPFVFTPFVFTPFVFTPSATSPSSFSPFVFTPFVFTPSNFDPLALPSAAFQDGTLPSGLTDAKIADAFGSAQTRSLLGVSANDGTAPESAGVATWNNTGYFYIRVSGRNGAFSPQTFHLSVTTTGGPCNGVTLDPHDGDATIVGSGSPQTLILTDPGRLPGSDADKAALATKLTALAAATNGTVVNLANSPRVVALNRQADGPALTCPYAKNLVAQSIRDIVNSYRGSLKYVVIVGGDHVVPFFRYPDAAGLGPESDYVPPVSDTSASQASLRTNTVLGQDAYGAASDLSVKGSTVPIPDLAVGRLVETAAEISANVQRYLDRSGAAIRPSSSLVTGYDFLTDAANAVEADLAASVPNNTTLITDADVPRSTTTVGGVPDGRHSWTATDLSRVLFGSRHDITFLAGHFSANNALAADYSTSVSTDQVASAPAGTFANTLVFSAGCHSGYNVVDTDGVAGVTNGLDWAQAFAQQGATLVAGTGYQYGDTDFVRFGEQLYGEFVRQLRYGTGAVAVGDALTRAKATYLAGLTTVSGIDQKTLLESTLFGLPMQGVDLPAGRGQQPGTDTSIATPVPVTSDPGLRLNLQTADVDVAPTLQTHTKQLTSSAGGSVTATYLSGPDDAVVANPGQPTVPLQSVNVSSPTGQVLRGVGFRSGTYTDTDGITPLVGVATTEQSGAHTPFASPTFFPNRIASPNYFGTLSPSGDGTTRLAITPVQHRTDSSGTGTDTQRVYSDVGYQLFYSSNIATYGPNQPGLAAAPTLSGVTSSLVRRDLHVEARVVGDPSAGIQNVWVTYTGETGSGLHGRWQSLDLTQDPNDSTLWSGVVTLPDDDAKDVRFLVQAVNGVGLVGADDNQGAYYAPAVVPGLTLAQQTPTSLTLGPAAASVAYGASTPVTATLLDSSGAPVVGRSVTFGLGASAVSAPTAANGVAAASLPVSATPGTYPLSVAFAGDTSYAVSSSAANPTVTVTKAPTALAIGPGATPAVAAAATLTSAGTALRQKTVVFVVRRASNAALYAVRTAITDGTGTATLASSALPSGAYTVTALFGSAVTPLPSGSTTDLSDPLYAAAASALVKVTTALTPLVPTIIGRAYTSPVAVPKTATASASGLPAGLALAKGSDGSWSITGTAPRTAGWYTIAITSKDGTAPASTAYYLLVVGYATTAFAAPVNDPPGNAASVFPASSTVPLRIRLTDSAGVPIPASEAAAIASQGRATVLVVQSGTTSAKANETKVAPVAQSGSAFSYDSASGQFVYYANAARFSWVAGRTYLISLVVVTNPGQLVAVRAVPVGFAKG